MREKQHVVLLDRAEPSADEQAPDLARPEQDGVVVEGAGGDRAARDGVVGVVLEHEQPAALR
jgi:hypothetical protein